MISFLPLQIKSISLPNEIVIVIGHMNTEQHYELHGIY